MKRFFSIFLMIAVLAVLFAACDDKPGETSATSNTSSGSTTEGYKSANDPTLYKGKNKEFNVIVNGVSTDTYQSHDFDPQPSDNMYGELLVDAVGTRDDYVEETYGFEIVVDRSESINATLQNLLSTGDKTYHLVMPKISAMSGFARNNYLADLKTIDTIDIDAEWYDQNANAAFSVGNKLYFTVGDITISNKVCTNGVLFNKTIINEQGLDSPYDLVNQGKWTFDAMYQMARQVHTINDPDVLSTSNVYGMLTGSQDALGYYGAMGGKLCEKDENDEPYMVLNTSINTAKAQFVLEQLLLDDWNVWAQAWDGKVSGSNMWDESFKVFHEGRCLFRVSAFSATTKMRKLNEIDFGVVPMPKWDEQQANYISYCSPSEVSGLAIPNALPDDEKSFAGYCIDVLSAESKNYLTPAYMDTNINRDIPDAASLPMLDIIFGNIVYDVGSAYDFGALRTGLSSLLTNKSSNITSWLEQNTSSIEKAIEEMIEAYKIAS